MWTDLATLKLLTAVKDEIATPAAFACDNVKIVTFKATFVPSRNLAWADMAALESDFGGYARKPAATAFANVPASAGGIPKLTANEVTFSKNPGAANQDVFGWGLVACDAGGVPLYLINAVKWGGPATLTDAAPDVSFTPFLGGYPL